MKNDTHPNCSAEGYLPYVASPGDAAKHSFRFWHELGGAAQQRGLTWGGLWRKFPDPAHVEMPNWRTQP